MTVSSYILRASNGKAIRTATMVILENGKEVRFVEKLSKKEALRQAAAYAK